ncbi:MAG: hypothetical protein CTY16_09390 [Methylobacter sp.]|nr:MAG: hypothetical protein CTY16_09390 [Methylobacter sp.]
MNSLNYQKIFRGLTAIGILIVILLPHMVIELTIELLHMIWELTVEAGHIIFEWVEISLDTVIELMFETDLHNTQIIVFYIIMTAIGFGVYRLSLFVPGIFRRIRDKSVAFYLGQKNYLSLYWKSLTLTHKLKWGALAIGLGYWYLFIFF